MQLHIYHDQLRAEGVIGKAINFDGVNDYLELPLDSHPPAGTNQLTISFWTHGNFASLQNSTLFESGSGIRQASKCSLSLVEFKILLGCWNE